MPAFLLYLNQETIMKTFWMCLFLISNLGTSLFAQRLGYGEKHRPQFHFSPPAHWMNDPNGMVYYKGTYHLFYQYYPDSTVWGPMHWGHTISTDLIHWKNEPIALFPDSLGYIFSGSVIADNLNTSGFKDGKEIPLVAIFTFHNMKGEKSGSTNFQYQGLAYSVDKGITWKKYSNNPVLKNSVGEKDFRDPKVFWYEPQHKWIMTLAVGNKVQFYQSSNLKDWKLSGAFGKMEGSHGGVWECPDLFPIRVGNTSTEKWVLLVSIGTGAINGGSGTQYFIGNFDGETFHNENFPSTISWLDYGTDNYAGVTWSNEPSNKRIFLGWMSNWQYAQTVPTNTWRSSMTMPRELKLEKISDKLILTSAPVSEIKKLRTNKFILLPGKEISMATPLVELEFSLNKKLLNAEFNLRVSNTDKEYISIGFDKSTNEFYIDRTHAGFSDFYKGFAAKHLARRISKSKKISLHLFFDRSSVEMFADNGSVTMTDIYFPKTDFTKVLISSNVSNGAISRAIGYNLKSARPKMK